MSNPSEGQYGQYECSDATDADGKPVHESWNSVGHLTVTAKIPQGSHSGQDRDGKNGGTLQPRVISVIDIPNLGFTLESGKSFNTDKGRAMFTAWLLGNKLNPSEQGITWSPSPKVQRIFGLEQ